MRKLKKQNCADGLLIRIQNNLIEENYMRRIFAIILIALSLLALWSCDIFGTEHTHQFGEWDVVKEASCTEDGNRTRFCSCGESEKETLPKIGHTEEILPGKTATCTEDGYTDSVHCKNCGIIFEESKKINQLTHEITVFESVQPTCTENGHTEGLWCVLCGEIMLEPVLIEASHKFLYHAEIDENGNEIYVGVCQRSECEQTTIKKCIPGLYDTDKNLLCSWDELVDYGFNINSEGRRLRYIIEKNDNLQKGTTLIIDDSVTTIGAYAFEGCKSIANIEISNSVTSIGLGAFLGTSIREITIPSTVEQIGNGAFGECYYLKNIFVDENNEYYKSICGNLYSKDGKTLLQYAIGKTEIEFIVPDGVTIINTYAFAFSSVLTSITIPSSVTGIGACAFDDCVSLKNVYFNGTTEEWDAIKNIKKWLPNNVIANYDDKIEFLITTFIEDPSSSVGYYVKKILIENNNIYIDNELYIGTYINDFIIEYDEKLFSWAAFWKDEEAKYLDVLSKIEQCEKIYMLEKTTNDGDISKIAVCFVDNVYYYLLFNEVDVNKVNYIYESHIELKE
jgi:hypothetical protein